MPSCPSDSNACLQGAYANLVSVVSSLIDIIYGSLGKKCDRLVLTSESSKTVSFSQCEAIKIARSCRLLTVLVYREDSANLRSVVSHPWVKIMRYMHLFKSLDSSWAGRGGRGDQKISEGVHIFQHYAEIYVRGGQNIMDWGGGGTILGKTKVVVTAHWCISVYIASVVVKTTLLHMLPPC